MSGYLKAIVAFVGAILTSIAAARAGNGEVDTVEFFNLAVQFVGGLAVFLAPNLVNRARYEAWLKAIGSGVLAVLVVVISAVTGPDGVSWQWEVSETETWQIIIAIVTTASVFTVPNRGQYALAA